MSCQDNHPILKAMQIFEGFCLNLCIFLHRFLILDAVLLEVMNKCLVLYLWLSLEFYV